MTTDARGSVGETLGAAGNREGSPSPAVRSELHRVVDVAVPGGSTLRIARVHDAKAGDTLLLAHGFGTDETFRRPDYCGPPIQVSADVLDELRAALDVLAEEGES